MKKLKAKEIKSGKGQFDTDFKFLFELLGRNGVKSNGALISIVIPVYNEEKSVKAVLSNLPNHESIEVIVVDDNSTDNSLKEIKAVQGDYNLKLKIIKHKKNQGYGRALLTGIAKSTGEIILTMDSDGQHRAEDLFNLVEPILANGADITVGSRYMGTYNYKLPLSTRIGEAVIEKFISILFRQKIMNNQGGFRAFHKKTRKIFEDIRFEDYAFTTELLLKAALSKFKIKEVPIHLLDREHGSSKIILTKLILHIMLCVVYYTIQWVNRPYINKWMIKRVSFLKKLPIYGKPKRIQRIPSEGDKIISVAYYVK